MDIQPTPRKTSWLSLVAETAGVTGATVARVDLGSVQVTGSVRVAIQVRDAAERVVGATFWYGEGSDLARGVSVDLGCDVVLQGSYTVTAWIDEELPGLRAERLEPPLWASEGKFEPWFGMKLMLRSAREAIGIATQGPQAA